MLIFWVYFWLSAGSLEKVAYEFDYIFRRVYEVTSDYIIGIGPQGLY